MKNLVPMEYENQRIMTTKVLAEAYKTNDTNISSNFSRNKDRFIEGKHYYHLEGEALRAFKGIITNSDDPSIRFARVLTLWTERGALRHAKILDTDEAWEVYEKLEDTYFRVKKQEELNCEKLSPEIQLLQKLIKVVRQNADTIAIEGTPRQRLNIMVKKLAFDRGILIPAAWQEFRRAFNTAFQTNLEQRKTYYQGKNQCKNLSYPDFLEKTGLIEDALRVADKLIKQ